MTTRLATCSYREYVPEMGTPVRISLGRPRWWSGTLAKSAYVTEITPRHSYLHSPEREYLAAYTEQLKRYGVDHIEARFSAIAAEHAEPLVLLCFETLSSGSWCHRSLFAAFWLGQTGQDVPELGQEPR